MFAADADTFLADLGSPARWTPSAGGATVRGLVIIDLPADVIEGGETISSQYMVTLATATWRGLKRGETLVVDGDGGSASYRLRTDMRAQDDGVFSVAGLTRI